MNASTTFDISSTTSKENMRKKIRHALTQKSTSKFPNIDIHAAPFEKPENIVAEFLKNFRNAGGKCIICNRENFVDYLRKLIVGQRYATILNTASFISQTLEKKNINFTTCLDANQETDVAIVYSDTLIARTGSLLFAPKYSLYPSVRNLSKDIIVIAFEKNITLDLKDAFTFQQEKNQGSLHDFIEIITPTKHENNNGEIEYSPTGPRFILLLIQ